MRATLLRRLVLACVLTAFAVASLAGPFRALVVCLGRETVVAVGACGCTDHRDGPADGREHVRRERHKCCVTPCACLRLSGAEDPQTSERRADPLPAPDVVAAASAPFDAVVRFVAEPAANEVPRPPPRVLTAPHAPRVLRL